MRKTQEATSSKKVDIIKVSLLIIAVWIAVVLMQTIVVAVEGNPAVSFTERGGKGIADREAENWSHDAKLIMITNVKGALIMHKDGSLSEYTTGWAHYYRSDSKYFEVLIEPEIYPNETGFTYKATISKEPLKRDIEFLELYDNKPLDDWLVISSNAMKIAGAAYKMSLERGDGTRWLFLEMEDVDSVPTPVWHVSITHGITGIMTNYGINANTGEILREFIPPLTKPTPTPTPPVELFGYSETVLIPLTKPTPTPTPPGFEVVFAIAGLLVVAYLLRKMR